MARRIRAVTSTLQRDDSIFQNTQLQGYQGRLNLLGGGDDVKKVRNRIEEALRRENGGLEQNPNKKLIQQRRRNILAFINTLICTTLVSSLFAIEWDSEGKFHPNSESVYIIKIILTVLTAIHVIQVIEYYLYLGLYKSKKRQKRKRRDLIEGVLYYATKENKESFKKEDWKGNEINSDEIPFLTQRKYHHIQYDPIHIKRESMLLDDEINNFALHEQSETESLITLKDNFEKGHSTRFLFKCWQKFSKSIYSLYLKRLDMGQVPLIEWELCWKFSLEIFIILPFPLPLFNLSPPLLDQLCGLWVYLRYYIILKLISDFSMVSRKRRVLRLMPGYAASIFDSFRPTKALFYYHPITITLFAMAVSAVYFGIGIYIFEFPVQPHLFTDYRWALYVSVSSILTGWPGDPFDEYTPISWGGKSFVIIAAVAGLFLYAILIDYLHSLLRPTKVDSLGFDWITAHALSNNQRHTAANVIKAYYRRYKDRHFNNIKNSYNHKKNKSPLVNSKQVFDIYDLRIRQKVREFIRARKKCIVHAQDHKTIWMYFEPSLLGNKTTTRKNKKKQLKWKQKAQLMKTKVTSSTTPLKQRIITLQQLIYDQQLKLAEGQHELINSLRHLSELLNSSDTLIKEE